MGGRHRLRGETGETLIEAVVALAIFGVAFVVIVGGMFTTEVVADRHRKSATAETILRQFAEAQIGSAYVNCALAPTTTTAVGAFRVRIEAITYWNDTAFVSVCPSSDRGLQLVRVRVTAADGRADETVDVVKRRLSP